MSAARNYPNRLREQEPGLSLTAAGPGGADTLRGWCKRAEIDTGRAPRGSNTRSGHTDRFRAGIVLYTGRRRIPVGDRL